ncbi:hypothetical protein [Streptomyces sp. NPDC007905]|uniref:hypothetical protein n=1 Tax=Streptomyces sp. NPDC007905 TaxID=3364788 RepID=UPI0036E4BDE4
MQSIHPDLAGRVRRALKLAGFHVVDEADDTAPGLKVSETPTGVPGELDGVARVRRAGGRSAWGVRRRDADGGAGRGGGLLVQCGHTVVESPDGNGIVVLAEGSAAGA